MHGLAHDRSVPKLEHVMQPQGDVRADWHRTIGEAIADKAKASERPVLDEIAARVAADGLQLQLRDGSEHLSVIRLDRCPVGQADVPPRHVKHDIVGVERHHRGGVIRLATHMRVDNPQILRFYRIRTIPCHARI